MMSESKPRDLSMNFSVQIINLIKDLKLKHKSVISNQIGRSGTSIGANICEAYHAKNKHLYILTSVGRLVWLLHSSVSR